MAQAIHCDGQDHRDALADVLVTHLANGDTSAWCFAHYVQVCQAVVETVNAAETAVTDADAEARLAAAGTAQEGTGPAELPEGFDPGRSGVDAADQAHLDEQQRMADELPRSPDADALGVAQVVKAGTSPSRKAYEARQRAKEVREVQEATLESVVAPGPASEATEDATEPSTTT